MNPVAPSHIQTKHRIEFMAARVLVSLIESLPDRPAYALGRLLSVIGFYVIRYRRAEARRRILSVFGPAMTLQEADRIAGQSFHNLVLTLLDGVRSPRLSRNWIEQNIEDKGGFETIRNHCAAGHGAVLAVPHMGSWELAGAACPKMGIPLFSLSARYKNPLMDEWIRQRRTSSGFEILTRGEDALAAIPRRLKRGQCFAILPDVRHPRPALPIPFLGGTANIAPGMALFARLAHVPIFPCILKRLPDRRHRFQLCTPISPNPHLDREEDLLRMTRAVMVIIEQAIQEEPGQWFWFNKRWILDPL